MNMDGISWDTAQIVFGEENSEQDRTRLDQLYEEYGADKHETFSNEIITLLRVDPEWLRR